MNSKKPTDPGYTVGKSHFIVGTDTGVGKTFCTCALLHAMQKRGIKAIGMKPVAAGTESDGQNEDVRALLAASTIKAAPELVNPYCFTPAIAPHIAAAEEGIRIDLERILAALKELQTISETVLVEGVGGFIVPLGPDSDTADLAVKLALPVILVVGMRLGCINHAMLTARAISACGLQLDGWIANRIDPQMNRFAENLEALQQRLDAPLLGIIPANSRPQDAAQYLDLDRLRVS